jgi:hypothetical protein
VSPALPAGLTINATTGVVSGTPTAVAQQATHVVTATDGTNSATSNLTVVVSSTSSTTSAAKSQRPSTSPVRHCHPSSRVPLVSLFVQPRPLLLQLHTRAQR